MIQQIHLMSGIPASGKSHYLNNNICEDVSNRILHRDDVRAQLREHFNKPDEYFPCSAEEEYKAWITACASVIIAHPHAHHYYFDQTSLGNGSAAKFFNALAEYIDIDDFELIVDILNTDPDLCYERNAAREGFARVPDDVFFSMIAAPFPDKNLRKRLKVKPETRVIIHDIIEDTRVDI